MTDRPRCEACGAVLALNPGTLCRPCLEKRRAQIDIPDYVLALIENADAQSIELVAKLLIEGPEDADASADGDHSPNIPVSSDEASPIRAPSGRYASGLYMGAFETYLKDLRDTKCPGKASRL